MNYKRQTISYKGSTNVYRNITIVLFTFIFILLCGLALSSMISSGHSEAALNDSYQYYTSIKIEEGDTLWEIAEQYITPEYGNIKAYVNEIKEINQLGEDNIHIGQYLIIPYFSEESK